MFISVDALAVNPESGGRGPSVLSRHPGLEVRVRALLSSTRACSIRARDTGVTGEVGMNSLLSHTTRTGDREEKQNLTSIYLHNLSTSRDSLRCPKKGNQGRRGGGQDRAGCSAVNVRTLSYTLSATLDIPNYCDPQML